MIPLDSENQIFLIGGAATSVVVWGLVLKHCEAALREIF